MERFKSLKDILEVIAKTMYTKRFAASLKVDNVTTSHAVAVRCLLPRLLLKF